MYKEQLFSLTHSKQEIDSSSFNYYCLTAPNQWRVVNAIPLRRLIVNNPEIRNSVMSLRLGTGIIGELDCPSGDSDKVPKGKNEVILGIGQQGIEALLQLGALPCISCHSGKRLATISSRFLEEVLETDISHADDTNFLVNKYDARRLNWQKILPLGIAPSRLYTRPGLNAQDVLTIEEQFKKAQVAIPLIGFYDRTREDRFFRYN